MNFEDSGSKGTHVIERKRFLLIAKIIKRSKAVDQMELGFYWAEINIPVTLTFALLTSKSSSFMWYVQLTKKV